MKTDQTDDGEKRNSKDSPEQKHAPDMLLRNAIQLLHHPQANVANEASSLLALAFAYSPKNLTVAYVRGVQESIHMALNKFFQADKKFDNKDCTTLSCLCIASSLNG